MNQLSPSPSIWDAMPATTDSNLIEKRWTTRTGVVVILRPIRESDEAMMLRFHQSLSPQSIYTRYFSAIKLSARTSHPRLARVCHPELRNETVLVAQTSCCEAQAEQIVAVGRLSVLGCGESGELAFVVSDAFQRQGIGSKLFELLLADARRRGLKRVCAHVLRSNSSMLALCDRNGMTVRDDLGCDEVTATLALSPNP